MVTGIMRWARTRLSILAAAALATPCLAFAQGNPDRLLWGDTHLHTNLSTDAYLFGNETGDADTAYRFAKGAPAIHPQHRAKMQLETPLDFLAVTDHANMLGVPYSLFELRDPRVTDTRMGRRMIELVENGRQVDAFGLFLFGLNAMEADPSERPPKIGALTALRWKVADLFTAPNQQARALRWIGSDPSLFDELRRPEIQKSHWEANVDAAERHNEPGKFTTLIGWEYTPTPGGANLHRVVLTPADGATAKQFSPFSSMDSSNPEDLWAWLDETSAVTGADFVSIPHNSNVSKGRMFARTTYAGDPIDEGYARLRSRWEPVVEVTQIKGDSETHPILSPEDEFADFEFFNALLELNTEGTVMTPTPGEGDYVRSALKTGLEFEEAIGVNPFKLGMIGATDTHSGLASAEEHNFTGKMAVDSTPEAKEFGLGGLTGWEMSTSGLAAVWARDNTREEITAALKRREVYGTTGPRIGVRFFGGYDFAADDAAARDLAETGYRKGVPMGGDLTAAPRAPSFLVRAVKDPKGANLDRVQIIKGWVGDDGKAREKIFNVVWSDNRALRGDGRLPDVGDTVDRDTGRVKNTIGSPELAAVWRDPAFDPEARAFYYVRVLQIPTPRNSFYDSLALDQEPPEGYAHVIQERAYTSPIWYTPG